MNNRNTEQNSENSEEFIYGLKGLCQLLSVSRGTALRIKKQVPHYQCGRTLRFKKSEVLRALSKNPVTL